MRGEWGLVKEGEIGWKENGAQLRRGNWMGGEWGSVEKGKLDGRRMGLNRV